MRRERLEPQPQFRWRGAGVDEGGDEEFEPERRNQSLPRFPFEEPKFNTSSIFVEEPVVTRFIAHCPRLLLLLATGLAIGFLLLLLLAAGFTIAECCGLSADARQPGQ